MSTLREQSDALISQALDAIKAAIELQAHLGNRFSDLVRAQAVLTNALQFGPLPAPERVTQEIHGLIFDKVNDDLWVHLNSEGERVFELSRQDYEGDDGTGDPALEDDWGVWSNVDDDWAHVPTETGFPKREQAIAAFGAWLKANK